MKQTQKSLLGLGVVIVIAGAIGAAALWARRDEEAKQEQKDKAEKLFAFDKAKVRALLVEKDGKLLAEASREAADKPWALAKPVKADADQANVNAIVDRVADLKQKRDLGEDTDAKQPGLEAPRWKITVTLDDKSSQILEVGLDNKFDSSTYVRKGGDKTVRMIDGSAKSAWDKSLFDLRDKRVAHLDETAEIRAFSVINEDPYTLQKDAAGWKLTGPGNETPEAADGSTVDRIVAQIKSLRATAVVAEKGDLKEFGLDRPAIAIELNQVALPGAKDTFKRSIAVNEKGGKTYARRDDADAIFVVDAQIAKDLKKTWFELQDKTVAKFDREQVKTLQIDAPGAAQIAVARSKESKDGGFAEEKFTVEAPASGEAKRWKLSSALYSLSSLHAAAFVGASKDLKKFGLDKPRTYSVLGEGGKLLARIKIGGQAKDPKRVYAMAEGGQVVEVEQATINDLPKTIDDVLEPPHAPDAGTPARQAAAPK